MAKKRLEWTVSIETPAGHVLGEARVRSWAGRRGWYLPAEVAIPLTAGSHHALEVWVRGVVEGVPVDRRIATTPPGQAGDVVTVCNAEITVGL